MNNTKRGLAALSPERRRAITSMGGKKAHALGVAHEFTTAEAKVAGKKGGLAPRRSTSNADDRGPTQNVQ